MDSKKVLYEALKHYSGVTEPTVRAQTNPKKILLVKMTRSFRRAEKSVLWDIFQPYLIKNLRLTTI